MTRVVMEKQEPVHIRVKRQRAQRPPDGLSEKRLLFARWLVARNRLNEGVSPAPDESPPPGRDA